MKEISLEQNTPEWHRFRAHHIGASDAAVILGLSPYKTRWQLWQEKMGLSEGQKQNHAMRKGNELEPIVRDQMSKWIGVKFEPKVFQHSQHDWLSASLDGICLNDGQPVCAIEIKCPGKIDHADASNELVPLKYRPQLQTIMEVCGLDEIIYCSLFLDDLQWFRVKRDQAYIDEMIPKLKEFWDSLQNFEEPEPQYKHMESNEWKELALQWSMIQENKKDLLRLEDEARLNLIRLSGEEPAQGSGLKLMKVKKTGSPDYAAIIDAYKIDVEPYRKKGTEYWRITNE